MGSFVEVNDTLQITKAQGFPKELDYEKHLKKPFTVADFNSREFSFTDKKEIRIYQQPPVTNLFVENIDGKWLFWGMVEITEIRHDYVKKVTSGKYRIIQIYSPSEMKQMEKLIDRKYKFVRK
jgi:hypothetical protein